MKELTSLLPCSTSSCANHSVYPCKLFSSSTHTRGSFHLIPPSTSLLPILHRTWNCIVSNRHPPNKYIWKVVHGLWQWCRDERSKTNVVPSHLDGLSLRQQWSGCLRRMIQFICCCSLVVTVLLLTKFGCWLLWHILLSRTHLS